VKRAEEPPAVGPFVQRNGARYAVVRIHIYDFQPVETAVLLQELALYLDGLAVSLLLGGNAHVQGDAL
jgi:hypothetical protein